MRGRLDRASFAPPMVGHHSNTQGAGDFGLSFSFRSHFVRLMELGGDLLLRVLLPIHVI
jgi:hypothetical protein